MALSPSFSTTRRFPRAHTPRIAERPHTLKEEGSVARMGDGFGLGRVGQGLVRGGFEFDGCQMIQDSLVVGLLGSGQDCDVWLLAGGLGVVVEGFFLLQAEEAFCGGVVAAGGDLTQSI